MAKPMEIATSLVLPILAGLSNNVFYFSTARTILEVKRKGSLGSLNVYPFPLTFFNALSWVIYGVCAQNAWLWLSSCSGAVVNLVFLMVVHGFTPRRVQTHLELLTLALATLVAASSGAAYAVPSIGKTFFGVVGNVLTLCMLAVPLSVMRDVVRRKDAAAILSSLALATIGNNLLWVIYGFLSGDVLLGLSGIAGVLLGSTQITLKLLYRSSKPSERRTSPTKDAQAREKSHGLATLSLVTPTSSSTSLLPAKKSWMSIRHSSGRHVHAHGHGHAHVSSSWTRRLLSSLRLRRDTSAAHAADFGAVAPAVPLPLSNATEARGPGTSVYSADKTRHGPSPGPSIRTRATLIVPEAAAVSTAPDTLSPNSYTPTTPASTPFRTGSTAVGGRLPLPPLHRPAAASRWSTGVEPPQVQPLPAPIQEGSGAPSPVALQSQASLQATPGGGGGLRRSQAQGTEEERTPLIAKSPMMLRSKQSLSKRISLLNQGSDATMTGSPSVPAVVIAVAPSPSPYAGFVDSVSASPEATEGPSIFAQLGRPDHPDFLLRDTVGELFSEDSAEAQQEPENRRELSLAHLSRNLSAPPDMDHILNELQQQQKQRKGKA